jgi:YidC/Oxa1 family membrane protein insertase
MQALQPQLKALQDKYKNDRQVLNQKMMEFYRENNVSPFGSCLPLLLQLPVFLGLFYMLRTAGTAGLDPAVWGRWASVFVHPRVGWLWIDDITKFDLILMFLYIASQFVASWQMARRTGGQQKVIAYVMPLMIGIFMYVYRWPAGLFIYWFTSNLWTIGQQFVAEKFMPIHVPQVVTPTMEKTPATRPSQRTRSTQRTNAPGSGAGRNQAATRPATGGKGTQGKSAGKSGGKTSGQQTGQQGKATGSKGQRPNRGTGGAKSSGGA